MMDGEAITTLKQVPLVLRQNGKQLGMTEGLVIGRIIPEMAMSIRTLDLQRNSLGEPGGVAIVNALLAAKERQKVKRAAFKWRGPERSPARCIRRPCAAAVACC